MLLSTRINERQKCSVNSLVRTDTHTHTRERARLIFFVIFTSNLFRLHNFCDEKTKWKSVACQNFHQSLLNLKKLNIVKVLILWSNDTVRSTHSHWIHDIYWVSHYWQPLWTLLKLSFPDNNFFFCVQMINKCARNSTKIFQMTYNYFRSVY